MRKTTLLPALVESDSIKNSIHDNNAVFLDASFVMPGSPSSPQENFEQEHIPGAQFFDIERISDHSTDLPHMLPSADLFADSVAALGIGNDTPVIIYGQSGIVMGPARVWWTFRVFGHKDVRVLNGGLPAWKAAGLPLQSGPAEKRMKAGYIALKNPHLVRDLPAVKALSEGKEAVLIDARPAERFAGAVPEPRAGLRPGHIPGSVNMPCLSLIDVQGKMKSKEELAAIFEGIGLGYSKPIVTTCGSGVTACVLALALHELGYPDIPVYDGSWSEWGRADSGTEVESA